MGIKYRGPTAVEVGRDVAKEARDKLMRAKLAVLAGAELIKQQSVDNAPVDEHNLEDAHTVSTEDTGKNFIASVDVGGVVNGVDVERYAWIMHDTVYKPGRKSKEKAATGKKVGRKYLDRALEEKGAEALKLIEDAVRK